MKSSWRKALEEDKAEKRGRAVAVDDSVMDRLTPIEQSCNLLESPFSLALGVTSHSDAPVSQQGVPSLRTTQLWDTFAADSLNGTVSSAIQFSLDQETLPELPSCDSLLSLDDDMADVKSDNDDELLIPSLKNAISPCPVKEQGDCGSIMESRKRTPECLLSDHVVSSWLVDSTKLAETTDKVFSLELDALETPSPPKKQEYSLPKLITFSPIDDMKC